jgi:hypothetical protein
VRIRVTLLYLTFLSLVATNIRAQETYSIPATANQVSKLTVILVANNEKTCLKLNLATTCTQAQACTTAGAPGGASCSAAQARNANVRIYPTTQAGREEFLTFVFVAPGFQNAYNDQSDYYHNKYCAWWALQNDATKDSECSKSGAPNNCNICQR